MTAAADYSPQHTRALAAVRRKGAPVTFTKDSQSFDASTAGSGVPTSTSVSGYAVKDESDPDRYAALSLTPAKAVTLFFVPNTFGAAPALGASCTWAGKTAVVKSVESLAPAGEVIGASVIIV